MILWSASLLLFCTRGQQIEAFQKKVILIMPWSSLSYLLVIKRVKRKGNYQVCENNTLVCLPLSYLLVIKRVKRKGGNYQVCENNTSVSACARDDSRSRRQSLERRRHDWFSRTRLSSGRRLLVLIILHIAYYLRHDWFSNTPLKWLLVLISFVGSTALVIKTTEHFTSEVDRTGVYVATL